MTFWAHSDTQGRGPEEPGNRWQLLSVHLANVARLAEELARRAAPRMTALHAMARMAGALHDYGKYTECFQTMICTGKGRCPHAIHGALAVRMLPSGKPAREWAMPVVRAIAAHHAGLYDDCELDPKTRPNQPGSSVRLLRERAQEILAQATQDQPEITVALDLKPLSIATGQDLFTRMLLSCLVDADRLDTSGRRSVQAPLESETKLRRLLTHLEDLAAKALERGANRVVREVREQVQTLCSAAASGPARLFSLTVPTGGGKTLAAMRFALERAVARPEEVRRVIVVIPFLSIIEQNAAVYRELFGADALVEHHSGAVAIKPDRKLIREPDDDAAVPLTRPETENWDAPLIVTTSVRFFESLFSNHPSDLRRIHNIAGSVIVLDEVQTLPRSLLAPLLGMLRELTRDWGCTVVMATATQPAFELSASAMPGEEAGCRWPHGTVTPIVPPQTAQAMHSALRRVTVEWRLEAATTWDSLAAELLSHAQALCVVNTRNHAGTLFRLLREQAGESRHQSLFHLSTRMCAEHRLAVLEIIRQRLKAEEPCLVVSTQLIEAGVDVDFPLAYRALGPLDAIVQVAGRVDREGRRTEAAGSPAGRLIVFQSEDGKTPPYEYKEATDVTDTLARAPANARGIQVDDLGVLQTYFERYYDASDTAIGVPLAKMREDGTLQFRTLAGQFEMINSRTRDVFVPYGAGKALIEELRQVLNAGWQMDFSLLRKLQRYTVGLAPWDFERFKQGGVYEIVPGSDLWTCSPDAYRSEGEGLLERIPDEGFFQ